MRKTNINGFIVSVLLGYSFLCPQSGECEKLPSTQFQLREGQEISKALDVLLDDGESIDARTQAAHVLSRSTIDIEKARNIIPILEKTKSEKLQLACVRIIARARDPQVIPLLIPLLASDKKAVREYAHSALLALTWYRFDYGEKMPFIDSVKGTDSVKRKEIVAEWKLWWKSVKDLKPQIRAYDNESEFSKLCERVLKRAKEDARRESNIRILNDTSFSLRLRAEAASELRKMGEEEGQESVLPEVYAMANAKSERDRKIAIYNLERLRNKVSNQKLLSYIRNKTEDPLVRVRCSMLLGEKAKKEDLDEIIKLIKEKGRNRIIEYLLKAFQNNGDITHLPLLLNLFRDGDLDVRRQVVMALRSMGERGDWPFHPKQKINILSSEMAINKNFGEWLSWWRAAKVTPGQKPEVTVDKRKLAIGFIYGRVFDSDSNLPIQGVQIIVKCLNEKAEKPRILKTKTDGKGFYEVSKLLPGDYEVYPKGNYQFTPTSEKVKLRLAYPIKELSFKHLSGE